jgi:hypothetical protein
VTEKRLVVRKIGTITFGLYAAPGWLIKLLDILGTEHAGEHAGEHDAENQRKLRAVARTSEKLRETSLSIHAKRKLRKIKAPSDIQMYRISKRIEDQLLKIRCKGNLQ